MPKAVLLVDSSVNGYLVGHTEELKVARPDAGHITPLCVTSYRRGHALALLARWVI